MKTPDIPRFEEFRITCLKELDILDTPADPVYDKITSLVAEIMDVPICLVTLVDNDRQWFKSRVGMEATETHRDISFCGHVVFSNEPLVVENALEDDRFFDNPLVTDGPRIRFYAGIPLTIQGEVSLGTLCIIDTKPRKLSERDFRIFESFAEIIIEVFKKERKSLIDHLTGLYNRKMFDSIGGKFISRFERDKNVFSLITFDVDHFKQINDTYGHAHGDKVLEELAGLVLARTRNQDFLFRVGGEEFVILTSNLGLNESMNYAERLRSCIENAVFEHEQTKLSVTCSFGVASYEESDGDLHSLLKRSDRALYYAKDTGRNNVKSIWHTQK